MATLFDTTRNFSFYTVKPFFHPNIKQVAEKSCSQIPAAWLIAFLPHPYAVSLSKKFDNVSPRTYIGSLQNDQTIDQSVSIQHS